MTENHSPAVAPAPTVVRSAQFHVLCVQIPLELHAELSSRLRAQRPSTQREELSFPQRAVLAEGLQPEGRSLERLQVELLAFRRLVSRRRWRSGLCHRVHQHVVGPFHRRLWRRGQIFLAFLGGLRYSVRAPGRSRRIPALLPVWALLRVVQRRPPDLFANYFLQYSFPSPMFFISIL